MSAGEQAITSGGERRHLTVVFCDLVGSTALADQLDPEEVSELVLAYQEMGRAAVVDFGGRVAQYLGDGLLAYFGYPVAHEDDAERAVRAGLAVLAGLDALNERAWAMAKMRLEARVGMHTGPAIVGSMGNADRSDTSLFGSTPNIASRLESMARPGSVLISDVTRGELGLGIQLLDRGPIELKGLSQPVRAWEVLGVDGAAPRLRREPTVAMIGRDDELAALRAGLAAARAGDGQVIAITGEPGVGKSRLVRAIEQDLAGTQHAWLEFHCSELTASTPLASVRDLLDQITAAPDASPEVRWQRLTSSLTRLGDRVSAIAPYVADLLGFGDPNALASEGRELRRRRTLEALAEWTVALGDDRPLVIIAEDVHWCDPSSQELIGLVAAKVPGRSVLLVVTHRPERGIDLGDAVTTVEVNRLDTSDADALVELLADDLDLDTERRAALTERGDGIPLFIEELVKSARDTRSATTAPELPATLQGVLAARLDRLGPARRVARAASVLGRTFSLDVLEAVVDAAPAELADSLDQLHEAGLLVTDPSSDRRECRFRHALIQEAAYSSLLRRQRRELHAKVVELLRSQFAELSAAAPELMAHHLSGAGERAAAASWYERAGRRVAERAAFDEAVSHYEQALRTLNETVEEPERSQLELSLHILRANALMGSTGLGGADLLPIWERAIELAEDLGDYDELSSALNGAAVYYADHGDSDRTVATCERILDIANKTGSRVAALRGHGTLGMHRFFEGDGAAALEHFDLAIGLSRRGDFEDVTYGVGHDENVFFHTMSSWVLWWSGRPDASLVRALAGTRRAASLPSSLSQAMANHSVALARHLRGESEAATAIATINLRLSEEVGLPFWRGLSMLILGAERAREGAASGLDQMNAGLEVLFSIGSSGGSSFALSMIAEAQIHLGLYDHAIGTVDVALAQSADIGQPFYDPELLRLRALALAGGPAGRTSEVEAALDASWELALRLGASSWALRTAISATELLGRSAGVPWLQEALPAMADGESTIEQRRAAALLGGSGPESTTADIRFTSEERL